MTHVKGENAITFEHLQRKSLAKGFSCNTGIQSIRVSAEKC